MNKYIHKWIHLYCWVELLIRRHWISLVVYAVNISSLTTSPRRHCCPAHNPRRLRNERSQAPAGHRMQTLHGGDEMNCCEDARSLPLSLHVLSSENVPTQSPAAAIWIAQSLLGILKGRAHNTPALSRRKRCGRYGDIENQQMWKCSPKVVAIFK